MNYSSIYCALISKRLQNPLEKCGCIYVEKHHIIPKSEGGDNSSDNLVNLTAREHFIAHLLLARIYKDEKMWLALNRLVHGNNKKYTKVGSRTYESMKKKVSSIMSSKRKGKSPWMKGRKHSEETKRKISNAKRNPSKETIEKLRMSHLGKKSPMKGRHFPKEFSEKMSLIKRNISDETRRKMSLAQKRRFQRERGAK